VLRRRGGCSCPLRLLLLLVVVVAAYVVVERLVSERVNVVSDDGRVSRVGPAGADLG
jgi:hypothetical protein